MLQYYNLYINILKHKLEHKQLIQSYTNYSIMITLLFNKTNKLLTKIAFKRIMY
jgi:hypothetical protein